MPLLSIDARAMAAYQCRQVSKAYLIDGGLPACRTVVMDVIAPTVDVQ